MLSRERHLPYNANTGCGQKRLANAAACPSIAGMDVGLFVTCLTDTFYPRAGIAMVKVLEHLGCTVHFPREQTCCGQPMFNSGFEDEARQLARRMVDVFEPYACVVTPSGSCCAMIHDYYEQLLGDDPAYADRARRLIASTHEFVEYLTNVAKVDLRSLGCRWEGHVTYHYSCHLRGIGLTPETGEAARLLGQIDGVRYTQADRLDQCCGFGGTFAVKWPEVSGAMVRDKVECLSKTGATTPSSMRFSTSWRRACAPRRRRPGCWSGPDGLDRTARRS